MISNVMPSEVKTSDGENTPIFENLVWMNTKDAAIYLRKFSENGEPSEGAVRKLAGRGALHPRTWRRRLFFKKVELDLMLEGSPRK